MEHTVDLLRVEPEDPSAAIDGEGALGDSTSKSLHADACPGGGRR